MAEKRKEEPMVLNTSDITSEQQDINIQGVLEDLSPVKPGRQSKYFVGHLTDGNKPMRIVCFREERRPEFERYLKSRKTLKLSHAETKQSNPKYGGSSKLEIITKDSTLLSDSKEQFNVPSCSKQRPVTIKEAKNKNMDNAYIQAKVVDVFPKKTTKTKFGERFRQEAVLADESDSINLVLWGKNCESMESMQSVLLTNIRISEYSGHKYANFTEFTEVKPSTAVNVHATAEVSSKIKLVKVSLQKCCTRCRGPVVSLEGDDEYGCCESCNCLTSMDDIGITINADVDIENEDGIKRMQLTKERIMAIIGVDEDVIEKWNEKEIAIKLLRAGNITCAK